MKEKPVNTPIRKNTRKALKQAAIENDMTIIDYLDMVLNQHWETVERLRAEKQGALEVLTDRAANAYGEMQATHQRANNA